jgi:hypothetical protein
MAYVFLLVGLRRNIVNSPPKDQALRPLIHQDGSKPTTDSVLLYDQFPSDETGISGYNRDVKFID